MLNSTFPQRYQCNMPTSILLLSFQADNVWTSLEANMVALIVDGAAVNLGIKKGIGMLFKEAMKPRQVTVIHCAAHR